MNLGHFASQECAHLTRRQLMQLTAGALGATASARVLANTDNYQAAVERIWQHRSAAAANTFMQRSEWVHMATLAPSSHNTQPWKFRLRGNTITILPDYERRCPVVDPDDSHLFKSLGCAAENIAQAAAADGFQAQVRFDPIQDAVTIEFDRFAAASELNNLSSAIVERRCTRTPYDNKPIAVSAQAALAAAATTEGITPIFLQSTPQREAIIEYVRQGNMAQFADPAFVKELRDWIRFNTADAITKGDGLASAVSGQPSLPDWLGGRLFDLVMSGSRQADTDAKGIRTSAGIVAFVGESDDKASWVAAGRAYERFALQATALDIRNAFINQPIEVRSLRPQLQSWLGVSQQQHVHLLARYGSGPITPHSLRRPLDAVLIAT